MENPTVSYANVTSKIMYPKKDQAIVIDSIDGLMLRDYLVSLSTVTKPSTIRFISRIANSRICVYLDSKETANELVDVTKKIKVKDHILEIRPLISRNKRIVLSNVCPIIPHEVLIQKFNEMNVKILSPITFMKVGIPDVGFSHIMSFRRQLYVSPEDEKRLPDSLQIHYEDTNYWIYISNESMKCFTCNTNGHLAKNCPQSNYTSTATKNLNDNSSKLNENPISEYISEPQLQENNCFYTGIEQLNGVKRVHSNTTSEPSQTDLNQIDFIIQENIPLSDNTNDTDSNISLEEEKTGKNLKKKRKTLDNRSEEQVWSDIKNEIKELEDKQSFPLFPLSLDQLRSLLDETRNKHNIQEVLQDYTDNTAELINMCLFFHPKFNRNLKNRCSRFTRKLQEINLRKDK